MTYPFSDRLHLTTTLYLLHNFVVVAQIGTAAMGDNIGNHGTTGSHATHIA